MDTEDKNSSLSNLRKNYFLKEVRMWYDDLNPFNIAINVTQSIAKAEAPYISYFFL